MIHPKERAIERFGIDIDTEDLKKIVWAIQNNKSIPIYSKSQYNTVHAVNFNGKTLYAAYRKKHKKIYTFLTTKMVLEMSEYNWKQLRKLIYPLKDMEIK